MTEETAGGKVKKFLYVNRKAPYGTIYALESLEVVLIGAAFEQDVSLAFVGDGVYQLAKGQDTKGLEVKNFSPAFRALEDYDVTKLYVDEQSLRARGLMDKSEAKRNGKDADNLAPGFRISGLGQLIEAGIQAERLVVFGD